MCTETKITSNKVILKKKIEEEMIPVFPGNQNMKNAPADTQRILPDLLALGALTLPCVWKRGHMLNLISSGD